MRDCRSLGRFLHGLVERRPELHVRILVWSGAVVHAPGDPVPLLFGADWQAHPRIAVKLDQHHPLYAAHHQKIVVIDDRLAFAGGIDLTVERWDTCGHSETDQHRLRPDGTPYRPVHDIQMVVDGDAAASIGDVARERWLVGTGEALQPVGHAGNPWPPDLVPDFRDVDDFAAPVSGGPLFGLTELMLRKGAGGSTSTARAGSHARSMARCFNPETMPDVFFICCP